MFSYRKAQPKESETEKLLNTGDVTLEKLLACPDIANAYRNNNPKLLGYLLKEEHVQELYDIIISSKERSTHKTIISLFQTNNTDLHRAFADSIPLSQYAFKSLDHEKTENGCYAAGTMSRILSRAMDMWSVETHQVFKYSEILYGVVITNIDQTCVYYTVQDLISSDSHPLGLFIWCLFTSIAGEEFIQNDLNGKRPRIIFNNNNKYILPNFHKELNESNDAEKIAVLGMKLKKSLELLYLFFKKKKDDRKYNDLREFVLKYITSIFDNEKEFTPLHLQLARELGQNNEFENKVISKLQNIIEVQISENSISHDACQYIDQCLGYLTKFANSIPTEVFLNITISLLDDRFTQFTLLNLVEFVRRFFKTEREDIKQALETIDKLIIYGWNVFTFEDNQALESPEQAAENKLEGECLLLKSIIFDLWKAAHLPNAATQSTKETQYADDFENPDEDADNDFMKSQYGGSYGSSNDDDDSNEEKKSAKEIQNSVTPWSQNELADHQNDQFVNDIKIWFETEYLMSVTDTEPSQNQLRLDQQFPNVTQEIMDSINHYRWGKKLPIITNEVQPPVIVNPSEQPSGENDQAASPTTENEESHEPSTGESLEPTEDNAGEAVPEDQQ